MALSDTAQAELVKENKWFLLSRTDQVQVDDRVIRRYLPVIQEDLDTTLAKVKASATVTNPRVNQKVMPGEWINYSVGWDYVAKDPLNPRNGAQLAIVQELRKVADLTATGTGKSDEYREDAFEITDVERHRGAAAAVSDVTPQVAGQIADVTNEKRDDGKWNTIKRLLTAVIREAAAKSITITAMGKEEDLEDRNLVDEPTLPTTQTVGIVVSMRKRLNAFLRWDKTTQTSTATYLYDSGTYLTKAGTISWWWGVNATSEQYTAVLNTAALTSGTSNSLSKDTNRFGLIDYRIVKSPYEGGVYLWGESTLGPFTRLEDKFAHMYSSTNKRVMRYKRTVTYTYYIYIKHSYADAEDAIKGGSDGSAVISHGNGRYAGYKYAAPNYGNWEPDEVGVT